jgi:hypothetical protein
MKNLTYKAVDVMKKTKDTVTSQLTTAEKQNLVACLATTGITHIAISIPMDVQSVFTDAGTTPSPRTISGETQDWCDVIHAAGLKVIHRGTFCACENIWNVPFADGSVSTGSAASAASDGNTTWCGKFYNYLNTNVGPTHVENGDIFAPIPEGTTHAFDGHHFWTDGSQANYVDVFAKLHDVLDSFATANSKTLVFMSHNNYSEVRSGWIPGELFTDEGWAGFDYYGQYQGSGTNSVSSYITDLAAVYTAKSQPMYQGEWGDIAGEAIPNFSKIEDRLHYLIQFYKNYRDSLVDTNKLLGFTYWGGWEGQNTSIVYKTGSGASSQYFLNARGKILQAFFKNQGGMVRVPVVTAGNSHHTYTF